MKSKYLIMLAIVAALLVGSFYLFLSNSGATQPKGVPSLSAIAPAHTPAITKGFGAPPSHPQKTFSRGAYLHPSTGAAQPDKSKSGYTTPRYIHDGKWRTETVKQEGGETCADAYAISSLPFTATGYTCDNVNNYDEVCPYSGSTSPDVVYSYTPATDEVINIDLWGSSYDTKVYVYQDVCDNAHLWACNDDYYSDYTSAIFQLSVPAGHTYYIVIDGYGGACGDYLINVELFVPCDVVCPPGATLEGEPLCYDEYVDNYNGGCNSSPYIFQNITCPTTICGTSGTYLYAGSGYRDTDWFRLVLSEGKVLTFKCVAEFPLQTILLNGGTENCADYTELAYLTANPCDTATISMCVPAGVYWLWVGPSVFSGVTCGAEYVAIVDCETPSTGACCNNLSPYDCQITTPEECAAMPSHTFNGLCTSCGPPNPCIPPPANDNCDGAIQVYSGQTVYGSTVGATIDCPDVLGWPAVWYKIVLTSDCSNLLVDFCPMTIDLYTVGAVIFDECPVDCYNPIYYSSGAFVYCPNGTYNAQLAYNYLPAGTYYIPIYVEDYNYNEYIDFAVTITAQDCPAAPPNDECTGAPVINTFPTTVNGTTIGARVDCPDVLNWTAVWYEFDLPYNCNNLMVDFCDTYNNIGTVGIVLYNSCPPDCYAYMLASGYQWVSCPSGYQNPQIWWYDLPAGHYWFPAYVIDYNSQPMDFSFTVSADSCVPCDVVCPPGAMQENEPVCYDGYIDNYNGGCNSSPYVWQDITCNTTICGTSGVYNSNGMRDTDWFRLEAADGDLTFKCVAEFPVLIFLMDAGSENCADYTVLASMTAPKCDTAVISQWVPAGVYWLWVGPSDWGNYPCGVEYVAQVQCTGLGPRVTVTPTSFNPVLNPTGACSSSTQTLSISSVGSENLTYSVAENPPVAWLAVSPTSGTIPPGNTDVLNVSFDAGGMAAGDYYTNLDITTNAPKGVVTVPVHLKVELAPEISVAPRLWVPVIPGCMQDQEFRINNLGTGELRFGVDIRKGGPKLASKYDVGAMRQKNAENRANSPALSSKSGDMHNPAHLSNGGAYTPGTPLQTKGDTLFVQLPMTPDESWSFATSDEGIGYKLYEDFWDVTQSITDIHFWGLCLIYDPNIGWSAGDPNNLVFDITFYSDPPDDPTLPPTDVLCTYTNVVPTVAGTGQYYVGFEMYAFDVADLVSSCNMPDGWGWVSIQSKSAGQGYDWFLWASAQTGDGYSCQEGGTCPYYYDDAMILTGGVACPFTAAPETGTVPPESFFDVMLTFDGSFFDTCGVDTTTCNLIISSNDCDEPVVTVPVYMWAARGDVNADCRIDVLDVVYLLNYVFIGGPAPHPLCVGDVNRSGGNPDSDDALYLISYLFLYGAPPEMPSAPTR